MIVTLAGSVITYEPDDQELSRLGIELAAFDGEVGTGVVPIGDPNSIITVATGRQARIDEGTTLITDGFMLDQDRVRGPIPAGTARQYGFGLLDANALLDGFRIRRQRGAETDYARVMAFAAADGPAWDTAMVLNANTVTMPAKLYDSDGGWTSELIPDLVEFTGKTLFLHDKADGSGRCLHYHNLTSGHTSGLTITDVIADEDGVTAFHPWNPTRSRTSADLYNDVLARDQVNRTSLQTDATSISTHDADGLQHQSLVSMEATSQSDLSLKTAAYLASQKDDLDTYLCSIGPLDETALALIRVGDLIPVTSTVLGLTASTQRISHMTLTVVTGENGRPRPGWWMAALELGHPIRRRARVGNKAITDRITHVPVQPSDGSTTGLTCTAIPSTWTTGTPVSPWAPMAVSFIGASVQMVAPSGESLVQGIVHQAVTLPTTTGWGELTGKIFLPLMDSSFQAATVKVIVDDTYPPRGGALGQAFNVPHPVTPETYVAWTALGGGDPSDVTTVFLAGSFSFRLRVEAGQTLFRAWPSTELEPTVWHGGGDAASPDQVRIIIEVSSASSPSAVPFDQDFTYVVSDLQWCYDNGVIAAFHWTVYGPVPVQEAADGGRTLFTLPLYPGTGYVPGTLHVFVDGVEQNHTETDPAAGTFSLSWAPATGDQITASWLVP